MSLRVANLLQRLAGLRGKVGISLVPFMYMGQTTFNIILNIRTCDGFECFGKFFVGNNKKFAEAIFAQLKGKKNLNEKTILQLDLVETINGLPVNMKMISCSLEELAENCKIITKETFKILNLEET